MALRRVGACFLLALAALGLLSLLPQAQAFVPSTKAAAAVSLGRRKATGLRSGPRMMAAADGAGGVVEGVSVVLLAGGVGKRMKADRPKQFLELLGKPVLLHSLEIFSTLPGVDRIVIVLDKAYRPDFAFLQEKDPRIVFADPGKERQDSVFNGFSQTKKEASVVCIHDSARPLVSQEAVTASLRDGVQHGAAVLGVPMKATVKESEDGQFVLRTIPRARLWEIQTPQVVKPKILADAFKHVQDNGLDVTDDVSMVEMIGLPVKLTMGEYTNIKLTTPEDLTVAEGFLRDRAAAGKV